MLVSQGDVRRVVEVVYFGLTKVFQFSSVQLQAWVTLKYGILKYRKPMPHPAGDGSWLGR